MSVAEIGLLHGRYVRLSDRFKSLWTYHQFASGIFKNLIPAPLPYHIDFQNTYDRIKAASVTLNASQVHEAGAAVGLCELALDRICTQLLRGDDQVSPSIVRRFFEKLKKQDENIVLFLIKFYFYADALESDRRDKIDYLFTRIGEDFVPDRNQYTSRDSLEFRERIISLISILRLIEEIARFREFKQRFDESRAESNIKHDVITHLKQSMSNILAQLDRGLGGDEMETTAELPSSFFSEAEQLENISSRFGGDPHLHRYLIRIAAAIELADPATMPEEVALFPNIRELRLEPWEIAAYQKLFDRRAPEAEEDKEELWMLYLRAAALRLKVDEEATMLAASMAAGVSPEPEILSTAKQSLDCGKELDEQFNDFLHEAVYYSNPKILHQLYRSRFRLLRGFSGLWLIYDRGGQP